MDFLLECIGFPPDHDLPRMVELARRSGERAPWRGPDGEHFRLPLGAGLELRADRDTESAPWSVYPYFHHEQRTRLAVQTVERLPDSRYDLLVSGWANPPVSGDPTASREAFCLTAVLTDARRFPRELVRGHVLAVSLAGFAIDVESVGDDPRELERDAEVRRFSDGGWIRPLGGEDDPGGCIELALRVEHTRRLFNPLTGAEVSVLGLTTPERPLVVFTSPWQLEQCALERPLPGKIVRGVFLLTGRIAGGLPSATDRLGATFG
ncbi:MAG: hypothetical protein IT454_19220 [Planctomycetes bacterium]|nr:hypothetical protein [Planctomycetota bacterium]